MAISREEVLAEKGAFKEKFISLSEVFGARLVDLFGLNLAQMQAQQDTAKLVLQAKKIIHEYKVYLSLLGFNDEQISLIMDSEPENIRLPNQKGV